MYYKTTIALLAAILAGMTAYPQAPANDIKDTLLLQIAGSKKGDAVSLKKGTDELKNGADLKIRDQRCVLKIQSKGSGVRVVLQSAQGIGPEMVAVKASPDTLVILNPPGGVAGIPVRNVFRLTVINSGNPPDTLKETLKLTFAVQDEGGGNGDPVRVTADTGGPFIDSAMIASVSAGGECEPCKKTALIDRRSERQMETDYFIIYDRSLKFDAFTICKHIYRKDGSGKLKERYRKVAPELFAPRVGSQLNFQVINFRLTENLKILSDSADLFAVSSSFQSVLTAQMNATILKPPAGEAVAEDEGEKGPEAAGAGEEDSAQLVKRLYTELRDYVTAFMGSPCTIDQHMKVNAPRIYSRIARQFKLSGSSNDIITGLTNKFKDTPQQQLADDAVALLKSLDGLKPLAYATPRLGNRDYYHIKVVNGSNEVVASQNIRTSFGLKIDFSGGLFITGLKDYNYIFKDTSIMYSPETNTAQRDTSGRIIVRETDNKVNLGFGFLAHVYPRISSNYNIGLATGFMATTNLDLNVLLGGSLMLQSLFGENTRIALTGGVIWGKVNRLSKAVYEGLKMENGKPIFYPTSINTPSVVKVWERSWFFGITYNFRQ